MFYSSTATDCDSSDLTTPVRPIATPISPFFQLRSTLVGHQNRYVPQCTLPSPHLPYLRHRYTKQSACSVLQYLPNPHAVLFPDAAAVSPTPLYRALCASATAKRQLFTQWSLVMSARHARVSTGLTQCNAYGAELEMHSTGAEAGARRGKLLSCPAQS